MKTLYIFDLDDTLISTKQAYLRAYQNALEKHFQLSSGQARIWTLSLLEHYSSSKPEDLFHALVHFLKIEEKVQQEMDFVEDFLKVYWEKMHLFPGVKEFLKRIKLLSRQCALVSNGSSQVQREKIKHFELEEYFDPKLIMISGDYGEGAQKPSSFMHKKLQSLTGKTEEEMVYYGNTWIDALSAIKMDIDFFYFKPEGANANDPLVLLGYPVIQNWSEVKI